MRRQFPLGKRQVGGQLVTVALIECGCGCGATGEFRQSGHQRRPPEAIEQYFRNHGWTVGKKPRADRSPACTSKGSEKPVTQAAKQETKPELTLVEPREMSRDDRRIIFAKIDEIYIDEKQGYVAPWTDAAVAQDLGVPRAWVKQVRDEMFGPEGSNAMFDEYQTQLRAVLRELGELKSEHVAAVKSFTDRHASLTGRLDELQRVSRSIDKAIGRAS